MQTTLLIMAPPGMDAVRAEPHVAEATRVGQAFTDFYALHRAPLVRALTVTLSDAALAAESVDEAMTRAVQRWDKISGYSAPEGWVYRVAYNWATSRFRRLRRDRTFAPVIARSDVVEHETFDHDLHDALATLSKEHRAVLTLRFLLDWNVESTASALGVSPGTVKSRTSRALDVLAGRLERADAVPEEKDDVS